MSNKQIALWAAVLGVVGAVVPYVAPAVAGFSGWLEAIAFLGVANYFWRS